MRRLGTKAVLAITGVLAFLLIAYVFADGSPDQAVAAPHCTSQQALAQVKGELFRRAAAVRGITDDRLGAVARYAVVRAASPLVRRHHRGSSKVTCTGSLVLDLPPGVAVVGGRRSLKGHFAFDLAPQSDGAARLLMLSNADSIVVPLATVSNVGRETDQLSGVLPKENGTQVDAASTAPPALVQSARPSPNERAAAHGSSEAPKRAAPVKQAAPGRAKLPKKAVLSKGASAPARAKAMVPSAPKARPKPPTRSAGVRAKPSFDCRYARTRSEIAVCGDAGLASLDREMSARFYRAMAAANPRERAMLRRSRDRFLAYRDSCGSAACIANAYRERMVEIRDIMSGRW